MPDPITIPTGANVRPVLLAALRVNGPVKISNADLGEAAIDDMRGEVELIAVPTEGGCRYEVRPEPAAPAAEPTEAQRLAEGIICELVSEAEFGDIGDRLEDHAEGLAAIEFDQLRRNVADLISKATVTVTWPQDAEQAGGTR